MTEEKSRRRIDNNYEFALTVILTMLSVLLIFFIIWWNFRPENPLIYHLVNLLAIGSECLLIPSAAIFFVAYRREGFSNLKKYNENGLISGAIIGVIIAVLAGVTLGVIFNSILAVLAGVTLGLSLGIIQGYKGELE